MKEEHQEKNGSTQRSKALCSAGWTVGVRPTPPPPAQPGTQQVRQPSEILGKYITLSGATRSGVCGVRVPETVTVRGVHITALRRGVVGIAEKAPCGGVPAVAGADVSRGCWRHRDSP